MPPKKTSGSKSSHVGASVLAPASAGTLSGEVSSGSNSLSGDAEMKESMPPPPDRDGSVDKAASTAASVTTSATDGDGFEVVDRRSARKKEMQLVEDTLWPKDEQKKRFQEKTGRKLHTGQLLENVAWRDNWVQYKAMKSPGYKHKMELRNFAEKICKKRKDSRKGESNNSSTENAKKRKNRSLSLERSTTTPTRSTAKLPKIPKKSSTPQGASTSTSAVPTHPPGIQEEAVKEILSGEEDEPDVDLASLSLNPKSYAEAAEGAVIKEKRHSPWLLWVHKGKEDRRTITKREWQLLNTKLEKMICDRVQNDQPYPWIDGKSLWSGVGCINPLDEDSQKMVMEMVDAITVADMSFRAWKKGDTDKYTNVTVKIPATLENMRPAQLQLVLQKMNKFPEGSTTIRKCLPLHPGTKERILRMGITAEVVEAIKERDGRIFIGAGKHTVFWRNAPLTKFTEMDTTPAPGPSEPTT